MRYFMIYLLTKVKYGGHTKLKGVKEESGTCKVRRNMYVGFLREGDHLDKIVVDGTIKWMLQKLDAREWTGLIWLRTGTSGGLFGNDNEPAVYNMLLISVVAEGLLAYQEGLFSMSLVTQFVTCLLQVPYFPAPVRIVMIYSPFTPIRLYIILLWWYFSCSLCRHLHNAFTTCSYGCALSKCNYISRSCSQCFATCQPIHDLFLVNSYIILHNLGVITFFVQFPNIVLHVHIITKPFSIHTVLLFWCN